MTQKTRKVMEIRDNGVAIDVIKHFNSKYNPYKVYRLFFNESGWHREKVNEFADLLSCICYIEGFIS